MIDIFKNRLLVIGFLISVFFVSSANLVVSACDAGQSCSPYVFVTHVSECTPNSAGSYCVETVRTDLQISCNDEPDCETDNISRGVSCGTVADGCPRNLQDGPVSCCSNGGGGGGGGGGGTSWGYTIQGYKVPTNVPEISGLPVHFQSVGINYNNPYFSLYNNEDVRVWVDPPPSGYNVGYSICYGNATSNWDGCHDPEDIIPGTQVMVDDRGDNAIVDLWWHYLPIVTPTIQPTPTTTPIPTSVEFRGRVHLVNPGLISPSYDMLVRNSSVTFGQSQCDNTMRLNKPISLSGYPDIAIDSCDGTGPLYSDFAVPGTYTLSVPQVSGENIRWDCVARDLANNIISGVCPASSGNGGTISNINAPANSRISAHFYVTGPACSISGQTNVCTGTDVTYTVNSVAGGGVDLLEMPYTPATYPANWVRPPAYGTTVNFTSAGDYWVVCSAQNIQSGTRGTGNPWCNGTATPAMACVGYADAGSSSRLLVRAGNTPAAPTTVTVGQNSSSPTGQIRVSWSGVTGATGYNIYQQVGAAMTLRATVGASVRFWNDPSAVICGVSQTYAVSAINSANPAACQTGLRTTATGTCSRSNLSCSLTGPATVCSGVNLGTTPAPTVSFVASETGDTDYLRVYRASGPVVPTGAPVGSTSATSFTANTSFPTAGTYNVYCSASNSEETATGDPWCAGPMPPAYCTGLFDAGLSSRIQVVAQSALPGPSSVTVSDNTSGVGGPLRISWTSVLGANAYQIFRLNTSTGQYDYRDRVLSGTTSWIESDTAIVCGTSYTYRVRPESSANVGTYCDLGWGNTGNGSCASSNSWISSDGDIVASQGSLDVNVPLGEFLITNIPSLYSGIALGFGLGGNLSAENISPDGWLVELTSPMSRYFGKSENTFDYLKERIAYQVTPESYNRSSSLNSNIDNAVNSGRVIGDMAIIQTTGNLDVGATNVGDRKAVMIVNGGDLNINGNISVGNGFMLFLVDGDINISPTIGESSPTDIRLDSYTPHLEGIYYAQGVFNSGSDVKQLRIDGSVIGMGGITWGRIYTGGYPAEFVRFRPDMTVQLSGLGLRNMIVHSQGNP